MDTNGLAVTSGYIYYLLGDLSVLISVRSYTNSLQINFYKVAFHLILCPGIGQSATLQQKPLHKNLLFSDASLIKSMIMGPCCAPAGTYFTKQTIFAIKSRKAFYPFVCIKRDRENHSAPFCLLTPLLPLLLRQKLWLSYWRALCRKWWLHWVDKYPKQCLNTTNNLLIEQTMNPIQTFYE